MAVISKRGQDVIDPSLSPLDDDEADFLRRHVARLRAVVDTNHARGRFRAGSPLSAELQRLVSSGDDEFLAVANRLVSSLAAAMKATPNAAACVLALVAEGPEGANVQVVSLLKLDAEVEAAQLMQSDSGVRLRVFQDLLPRPGEIQKGFSWPDPRAPHSDLIVLDKVVAGSAVKYFQNAFEIDVSPRAIDTEAALVEALAQLPVTEVSKAMEAVGGGGNAEDVMARIREVRPEFRSDAPELGGDGSLGGRIRPQFGTSAKKTFQADNIELKVPLVSMDRVSTRREGGLFITTIVTNTPLTPVSDGLSADDRSLRG